MDNSFDVSLETGYSILEIIPSTVNCNTCEKCVAIFNAPLPRHIKFVVKFASLNKTSFVKSERLNDTSLTFVTPSNFPSGNSTVSVHHTTNQNLLCRYTTGEFLFQSNLERVHELLGVVSDPVSFMADALRVNEDDGIALDFTLEKILKTNRPANFYLLKDAKTGVVSYSAENHPSRNPTLLHFAARYNLVRLCLALVDSPGGREALNLQNLDGLYPHNLAEQCVNDSLAEQCVNDSLAKILLEAKEEEYATMGGVCQSRQRDSSCADRIYEHMSTELFQHYKQVKKIFVFPNKENSFKDKDHDHQKQSSFEESCDFVDGDGVGHSNDDGGDDLYAVCPPPRKVFPPPPAEVEDLQHKQVKNQKRRSMDEIDDYEEMEPSFSAPSSAENSFKAPSLIGFPEVSTRSISVPDIARGLFHGPDGGLLGKGTNPLLEELRRRNDMKRGSVPAISPLPRNGVNLPLSAGSESGVNRPLSGGAGGGVARPGMKSAGSSFESDHGSTVSASTPPSNHGIEDIYATPTSRPSSLPLPFNSNIINSETQTPDDLTVVDDSIYDFPQPQNKTPFPLPSPNKTPMFESPQHSKHEQQLGMEIYDTVRSSENDLYVPAARFIEIAAAEAPPLEEEDTATYDFLPPPTRKPQQQPGTVSSDTVEDFPPPPLTLRMLPTDFANLQEQEEADGFQTYDTPALRTITQKDNNSSNSNYTQVIPIIAEESSLYDVPSNLSVSVDDLTSSVGGPTHVGRPPIQKPQRNFGRTGKRNSEPVIPTFTGADRKLLTRQLAVRNHQGPPSFPPVSTAPVIPPRNLTTTPPQRSPKQQARRPMIPPPLPPQRQPKR